MQYMSIIQKSLSNAWRYKFLWLFGFFVALGRGAGGGGGSYGNSGLWEKLDNFGYSRGFGHIHIDPILIASVIMVLFFVGILFWFISVFAEGSLIHGISRKEFKLSTGFSDCLSAGANKFFRLLGIMFIAKILIVMLIIGILMFVVPTYFLSVGAGIALTVLAIPVLIVFILVVVCVTGWAIRYGTLYDQPFAQSFSYAWKLFTQNMGETIGIAFSSLLTKVILGIAVFICMAIIAIPFVFIGMVNLWLALVPGILLGLTIICLSSAYFGVFASSVWTIGFMQLTGYQPAMLNGTSEQPDTPQPPTSDADNYSI